MIQGININDIDVDIEVHQHNYYHNQYLRIKRQYIHKNMKKSVYSPPGNANCTYNRMLFLLHFLQILLNVYGIRTCQARKDSKTHPGRLTVNVITFLFWHVLSIVYDLFCNKFQIKTSRKEYRYVASNHYRKMLFFYLSNPL